MATTPAMTQIRPAATCTATVARKNGEDAGIGIPRTMMPWSVKDETLVAPPNLPLSRRWPPASALSCDGLRAVGSNGLLGRTQLLHQRSRIPVVSLLENLPGFEPHDGDAPYTCLFPFRRHVQKRRAVRRGPRPLDRSAIGVSRVADQRKRIPPIGRIHEVTEELPQRGSSANCLAQRDVLEPCILSVQLHKAVGFGAAEPAKPVSCPCVVHGLPPGSREFRPCLVRPNGLFCDTVDSSPTQSVILGRCSATV